MHRTRNAAYGQPYRGFESLPLRHPSPYWATGGPAPAALPAGRLAKYALIYYVISEVEAPYLGESRVRSRPNMLSPICPSPHSFTSLSFLTRPTRSLASSSTPMTARLSLQSLI